MSNDLKRNIAKKQNKDSLLARFLIFYNLIGYWSQVATKEELLHIDKTLLDLHFYMNDRRNKK